MEVVDGEREVGRFGSSDLRAHVRLDPSRDLSASGDPRLGLRPALAVRGPALRQRTATQVAAKGRGPVNLSPLVASVSASALLVLVFLRGTV